MTAEQKALEVFLKFPEEIKNILSKNKAFLAGGSILSGILDTKVNDYDLWFPDNALLINTYNDLIALGAEIEFNSENAWTLRLFDFKLQPIKKHLGDPITILRGFDFKFCQIGVNCASQELIQMDMTASQIKKRSEGLYTYIEPDWEGIPPTVFQEHLREERRKENEKIREKDCPIEESAKRYLKYFEKNLIHISPDAMIQMFLDSKVKIPAWLMAKSDKLWVTGWTEDDIGNLYPPEEEEEKEEETNTYY